MRHSFSIILPLVEDSGQPGGLDRAIPTTSEHPTQYVVVACTDDAAGGAARPNTAAHWLQRPGASWVQAVNLGLEHSDGQFVSWLCRGEEHADEALPAVASFFASHPDVDVVYGDALFLDQNGGVLAESRSRTWSRARLHRGCCLPGPAVFVQRRVIERHGLLDPRWRFWADYDYWLRLERAGVRFANLPRLLATFRIADTSNWLGALPRERTVESLDELNDLYREHLGKVSTRWIAHYGLVAAWQESQQARSPKALLPIAWRRAREAHRRWNGGSQWSIEQALHLVWRFMIVGLRKFRRQLDAQPALVMTSDFGQQFMQEYLKRRIFKLRHHHPRPLLIPRSYLQTRPPPDPPLISIVTPNLNQGPFLEATLRSVLDQGYPRLEYVVQDGGSTDDSLAVLRRYAAQLQSWVSEPDRGQADAVNRGMERVTGEILAYLNSDDLLLPGSLAYIARYFVEHPQVDIVYGHRVLIDEQGAEIGRWVLPPHDDALIPLADYIPQETLFWRRRAWDRVGARLDDTFQFAMDWELILRLRAAGMRFVRLPRFLGAFRISDSQKTQRLLATVGRREMDECRQRALGHLPSQRDVRRAMRPYLRRHWWLDKLYLAGLLRY